MSAFSRLLKISNKIDGEFSKFAMETSEVLARLDQILTTWIPEDIKEIKVYIERLNAEYVSAQQSLEQKQLVEMNQEVSKQAYQNIQSQKALLDYIKIFESDVKDLKNLIHNNVSDAGVKPGMELWEKLQGAAASMMGAANSISDKLKSEGIFMNPRELKSWRQLSLTIRDHLIDIGLPLTRHPFRSRLREPGTFNKLPESNHRLVSAPKAVEPELPEPAATLLTPPAATKPSEEVTSVHGPAARKTQHSAE